MFVLSRAGLHAAGLRFDFALDWMWLSDPADLRGRLVETLYYSHAFPPGMNLATGMLLKLGGSHASALALAMFWTIGLVLVNALFHLCRVSGLGVSASLGLAAAFSLLPQVIYFEHLYIYEHPIAMLLAVSAVLFHAAVRRPSFGGWLGFFFVCAAIGLTRTTFHLVWFVAMVGAGLWFVESHNRRRVLTAASIPAALLLALYAKNFALFGVFDAFTFGPVSQNLVTTWHLPPEVRESWIRSGTLSPFAGVSVYAGPRAYLPFFPADEGDRWPAQMTVLERPSVNAPNYNHWVFLEVNSRRRADALHYVQARPLDYAGNVLEGLVDMFTPSTEWHPLDGAGGSPHARHREVLGRYEALFTRIVHRVPAAPAGLYMFLPLVLAWGVLAARRLVRAADADAVARGALLHYCLFQIAFVVAASSLFTFRESARYRYQIEAMIWLLAALCLASLWRSWMGRRAPASGADGPLPAPTSR